MTLRSCSSRWRDYRLRSCEEIQEAALLTGEDRQSGAPDCFRHQKALFTGRNGRQESHGCDQPETGDSGGVKSEGMILCAEDADGNLSLMVPEKKMPAGAEIC